MDEDEDDDWLSLSVGQSSSTTRRGRSKGKGKARPVGHLNIDLEDGATANVILGTDAIPAIYKTAAAPCAVDVPLGDVRTIADLLALVIELGRNMVDADISASTIKVHYAVQPGQQPRKISRGTTLRDLRKATGLVVTPAAPDGGTAGTRAKRRY